MANSNVVIGAHPLGTLMGAPYNANFRFCTVLAADAVAMFVGDFVKLTGTTGVNEVGQNLPVVAQAAATEVLSGIVLGFAPHPDYLSQIYRTASTLRTAYVCVDPYVVFEIQVGNGTMTDADMGTNMDIVVAAGSTVTGLSGMQLDHSTASASDGQIRTMELIQRADNEMGQYAKVRCIINEHINKSTVGV